MGNFTAKKNNGTELKGKNIIVGSYRKDKVIGLKYLKGGSFGGVPTDVCSCWKCQWYCIISFFFFVQ
jgi:hypothetical protein